MKSFFRSFADLSHDVILAIARGFVPKPRAVVRARFSLSLLFLSFLVGGCANKKQETGAVAEVQNGAASFAASDGGESGGGTTTRSGPRIGAISMQVRIYEKPTRSSPWIGYLRLGSTVARENASAGKEGCPGGWYKIEPRGFVCVEDENATADMSHPLLRAASVQPDRTKPLPYKYAFVRAVAPQYLRVPTKEEQLTSEFALDRHLDWWKRHHEEANKVILGANDVFANGGKKFTELSEGELFGGTADRDPIPFWLEGSRQIPNVSGFKVPKYAVFANRVRRHTGLALIGSFPTGPESLERRFSVTTDLRLVPTSKLKADSASPFHGIAVDAQHPLPFAFIRSDDAHAYAIGEDKKPRRLEQKYPLRSTVQLTTKGIRIEGIPYRETVDGKWLKGSEAGFVIAPPEYPSGAEKNEKWIDISIENQVLVMYEGKNPIYATLVSTGQDGLGDPKTTKSTIRGTFRIKFKHLTATMDSNERSGSGSESSVSASEKKSEKSDKSDKSEKDPAEGKTVRRGQGLFELRDVPWVQYFEAGFALHASYWHDVFGNARSHGCVNLSPIDAHKLFMWTDPQVPPDWHGVITGTDTAPGTTVFIHR